MYDDYTFPIFCQRHKRDVLLSVTLPHGLFPIYPMVQFIVMKRHETGLLSLGRKPVEKRKLSQFQDYKNIQLALLGNVGEKLIVWTFSVEAMKAELLLEIIDVEISWLHKPTKPGT